LPAPQPALGDLKQAANIFSPVFRSRFEPLCFRHGRKLVLLCCLAPGLQAVSLPVLDAKAEIGWAAVRAKLVSGGILMRFKSFALIAVPAILALLSACGKSNTTATSNSQPATIALKDGTSVAGSITKSDTSSVTMQTPNGVVTTYPMSQVSSINYGPAPGQQPANAPPAAENTPAPAQNTPAPAPAAAPPAVAQNAPPPEKREYQPAATYRTIPAGTTLEVRNDQTIDSQTAEPGQAFSGTVVNTIVDSDGKVAIPAGS